MMPEASRRRPDSGATAPAALVLAGAPPAGSDCGRGARMTPAGGAPAPLRWLASACCYCWLTCSGVDLPAPAVPSSAEWFASGAIPRLQITLAPDDLARLRRDPRQDVPVQVREGAVRFARVAMHVKGSTGSFRSVDDKPALTLNLAQFDVGERFHGLRKIHLNNSVEDPSYFNEFAGSVLFRAAGVPAPLVTHAMVELNGRRLGLYVLKEGITPEFLGRHFPQTHGNLYDTGLGHDVDEVLAREQGAGPEDRRDLRALASAAREPDVAQRWSALGQTLDVEHFLSFMALEIIAGHRDGYSLARNNFRIYHDPGADRLVFLPHGMDQLFGRPDAPILPAMSGLVARGVMETTEGRRQYRERLALLVTNALDVARLHQQADAFLERVQLVLEPGEFRALASALAATKVRIAQRRRSLEQQFREPEPAPLRFEHGVAQLTGWQAVDVPADGKLDQSAAPDGEPALHLRAGAMTSASWRLKVLLPKGRYQFHAEVLTRGVQSLSFGHNQGAGLRIVGAVPSPPYQFVGDHPWTKLAQTLTLTEERQVEMICELRAAGGEAWFRLASLRLEQLR